MTEKLVNLSALLEILTLDSPNLWWTVGDDAQYVAFIVPCQARAQSAQMDVQYIVLDMHESWMTSIVMQQTYACNTIRSWRWPWRL